jgi:type VI secretion system protein ImpK
MTPASPARTRGGEQAAGKPQAHAAASAAAPTSSSSANTELQRLVAGINPLLGAASVLLALAARLRATTAHASQHELRCQLLARVGEFEATARASGLPRPKIIAARYVLCTFMDEVIATTPWGASGRWAERTLLQEFHEEAWGGDKAFKLLDRMGEDVAANTDLLELFYVCIALGFEGRYRGKPNGRAQLDAIAARLLQAIRPTIGEQTARTLSLRWKGVEIPDRAVSAMPLWVVFAAGALLVVGTVLVLNARLNAQARPVFQQILALPSALRSELLERSAATARPRLAPLLRTDINEGVITVRDEALRSVVVVPADRLFVPGTARLDMRQSALLARIADALAAQPGRIVVIGHTDDKRVNSVQFPSNWHLSFARAGAVVQALAQGGAGAERLRAEGRAEADPIAGNDTPEGRARNRRVEIELLLPRPEG